MVRLQQPRVMITGRCNGKECRFVVKASEQVKADAAGVSGLGGAIESVIRQLEARKVKTGNPRTFALGANGVTRYEFEFTVVEASDLIASHNAFTFEPNLQYPQELQPRLRDRAATRIQVEKIAENLEPEALITDFRTLDRGAPIVGPDLVVESGNGRIMALKLSIEEFPGQYQRYRQALLEMVELVGIPRAKAERMKAPVLVRVRLTDVNRRAFAEEANTSATIGSSAIEKARTDAQKITTAMLVELVVGENQSIEDALRSQANRSFVTRFLNKLPETEQATLVDSGGRINQDGVRRMTMALFVSAFQDADAGLRLAEIAFESIDLEIRNVINALGRSLGPLATAESLTRQNQRDPDLALGQPLASAVSILVKVRQTPGLNVEKYLAQGQLFDRELDEFEEQILKDLDKRVRSARRMAAIKGIARR